MGAGQSANLKVEIDIDNTGNFVLLDSSAILSVPNALSSQNSMSNIDGEQGQILTYSDNQWSAYDKISSLPDGVEIKGITAENLFTVKNLMNQNLFTINDSGVVINLPDGTSKTGTFEIVGLSGQKYLLVSPDSTGISYNDNGKKHREVVFLLVG